MDLLLLSHGPVGWPIGYSSWISLLLILTPPILYDFAASSLDTLRPPLILSSSSHPHLTRIVETVEN